MTTFLAAKESLKVGLISKFPVSCLETSPDQKRTDYGDIEELAVSLDRHGVLNPLSGYLVPDSAGLIQAGSKRFRLYIHDGNRRLRASLLLREQKQDQPEPVVPVRIIDKPAPEEVISEQVAYNTAKNFTPLELYSMIKDLAERGREMTEIAKALGFSVTYIKKILFLENLPESIIELVRSGEISLTYAITLFQGLNQNEKKETEERILKISKDRSTAIKKEEEARLKNEKKGKGRPKKAVQRTLKISGKDLKPKKSEPKAEIKAPRKMEVELEPLGESDEVQTYPVEVINEPRNEAIGRMEDLLVKFLDLCQVKAEGDSNEVTVSVTLLNFKFSKEDFNIIEDYLVDKGKYLN